MNNLYWCWFNCACAAIDCLCWFGVVYNGGTSIIAPFFAVYSLALASIYLAVDIRARQPKGDGMVIINCIAYNNGSDGFKKGQR